ncbi:hypothetical protein [Humidesulfovibrio sp.]
MTLTPKRAGELLQRENQPFLTTDEVSSIAAIKPATLSQWVKRGHVLLRGSSRPGTGRQMLFSFGDLIEILGFAHLSRLGFPPNRASGSLSELVTSCAMRRLADLGGMWGDPGISPFGDNFERYVLAWHNLPYGDVEWTISSTTDVSAQVQDAAWIVLDSHNLLDRAIEGLEGLKLKK